MAKNIKKQNTEKPAVGEAVSKTEEFFQKNKKTITFTTIAVIVVAALIVAYFYFIAVPKGKEAVDQTFVAEQYFRANNFESALNGDGNALGFAQIIDEYGNKAGETVYFYAGVCELQLGNAQNAIDYLKKYTAKDPIIHARALCCIGDAYVMLEKYQDAYKYFVDAANYSDNTFAASYLLKAGIISEEMGNNAQALKHYKAIKEKYPQTFEGYEIDKYISRIEVAE